MPTPGYLPGGLAVLSVPVFCGRLVERIASEMPDRWDVTLLDTNSHVPGSGGLRWATGSPGDYSFRLDFHWPPNMPPPATARRMMTAEDAPIGLPQAFRPAKQHCDLNELLPMVED